MRQAALPFLFHTIAFSISLYKELGYPGCTCRAPEYMQIEQASCTAISAHVRELRLRMRCPDDQCSDGYCEELELSGEIIFGFASRFPKLQVIRLESVAVYWDWNHRTRFIPRSPPLPLTAERFNWGVDVPQFEHLEISVTDILDTLAAFSSVERIHFTHLEFYDGHADTWQRRIGDAKLVRPVKISNLRVSECKEPRDLLAILHATNALEPKALTALSLSSLTEGCMPSLSRFLRAFGANLERLELGIFELDMFAAQCECMIVKLWTQF